MEFKDATHGLGYDFERQVMSLFGKDFRILSWAQDGLRTQQEIDFIPDLEIEHIQSKAKFGVECKFRSTLYEGRISWAKEYQPGKYQRYASQTGRHVFIVIGIGGSPSNPNYMYCIPLWRMKANLLNPGELKRYRRNPRRKFAYDQSTGQLT
ncbi:MAG TPA: hypothetical protein VK436_06880 [Methanocella sp.]|nr:hypothetical protein [Methanocella sp.]